MRRDEPRACWEVENLDLRQETAVLKEAMELVTAQLAGLEQEPLFLLVSWSRRGPPPHPGGMLAGGGQGGRLGGAGQRPHAGEGGLAGAASGDDRSC